MREDALGIVEPKTGWVVQVWNEKSVLERLGPSRKRVEVRCRYGQGMTRAALDLSD